jgi:hypothetical protein
VSTSGQGWGAVAAGLLVVAGVVYWGGQGGAGDEGSTDLEVVGTESTSWSSDTSGVSPSLASVSSYASDSGEERERIDEDEARERAADDVPYSYSAAGSPYGCTEDCSGHEAGYRWAADNGVTDGSCYGGDSPSFDEGCRAYGEAIEERAEEILKEEG